MARRNTQALTDIGVEEEVPVEIDGDYSFKSREEALAGMQQAIQLLEKFHNWVQYQNQQGGAQINAIAMDTNFRRKPMTKDGKAVLDAQNQVRYEEPYVNIQIRLPLAPTAISQPLHQSILIPEGE